jgi:hypothetical protein
MEMTMLGRRELTNVVRLRYSRANRTQKSKILDQFVANTGYCRKYAIGLLGQPPRARAPKRRRTQRRVYSLSLLDALVLMWETCECICSKRLKGIMPDLLDRLHSFGHLNLGEKDRQLLKQMSSSTIDRLLRPVRSARRPHGRSTTRGINGLKQSIPIHTHNDRHYTNPGHLEIDLVAHCGEATKGDYVCTLDAVDLATFWVEPITPKGRGQHAVLDALKAIRGRLPFAVLSVDSDNDSAFINVLMQGYCQQEGIAFGRSRPYRKNDQAHVEQRNWSIVRQLIGYDRYEGDAIPAFNALWEKRRLYVNFFQPVRKLLKKERIDGKVRKEYDEARTPYHRLIDSIDVTLDRKAKLTTLYESLDPVALKRDCDHLLRRLWDKHMVRFLADAPGPSK